MLVWFRNDIRIHDNPALDYALKHGVTEAVFLATPKQWRQHNQGKIKIDFLLRHVQLLAKQLAQLNIKLTIINVDDFAGQVSYIQQWQAQHKQTVVANSEVEINERNRDTDLINSKCAIKLFESDVIVAKGKVLNLSGSMYKVFTPFKKAWLKRVQAISFDYIPRYSNSSNTLDDFSGGDLQAVAKIINDLKTEYQTMNSEHWPLADAVEQQTIPTFLQDKIGDYKQHRDMPAIKATSGLSPYLAIGAISVRYLMRLLIQRFPDLLISTDSPNFTWLNELIWRDFYRHLLFHFPRLCCSENFNHKYDQLPWPNNQQHFIAWQQGKTGYPLVDAAMRQLNQTGWMHNRLRMVVASYLTKHLLVDWRLGEKYFSERLIDVDLAANNGGWQWSAGTGCDAQPYFRVFNPITQSQRFDPKGDFIRKYLPELKHIPDKHIHFPHDFIKKSDSRCYWPAIVDHKTARLRALEFYKTYS
ncbi:deoxyribodipyrimidine photo-lyase [Colwelliaceae bacterium BS250]